MPTGKKSTPPLRHYTIEVTDIDTGQSLLIAATWDDNDRRMALAQIMRLAGIPAGPGECFLEKVAPADSTVKKN